MKPLKLKHSNMVFCVYSVLSCLISINPLFNFYSLKVLSIYTVKYVCIINVIFGFLFLLHVLTDTLTHQALNFLSSSLKKKDKIAY